MIRLRIKQLMKERGILHPHKELMAAGISDRVAGKYLKGEKRWILHTHVEILCRLLRCVPNDLYEWVPDQPADDYPENTLQIIKQRETLDTQKLLKDMTLEDIRKRFKK